MKNKKGLMITIKVLLGLIIGLILLLSSCSIATDIIKGIPTNNDETFSGFVEEALLIAQGDKGNIKSTTLKLEGESVVLGFGAKTPSQEKNGRFYDGGIHLVANKLTDDPGIKIIHFPRPTDLREDESYLCLCEKPTLEPITDEYYKELQFDPEKNNMYQKFSARISVEPYKDILNDQFFYEPKREEIIVLTCGKKTCFSLGKYALYTPLRDSYFFQTKDYEKEDSVFENGFFMGYKKIEKYIVRIGKLSNNEIAFCYERTCFEEIEKAIAIDNKYTEEEIKNIMDEMIKKVKEEQKEEEGAGSTQDNVGGESGEEIEIIKDNTFEKICEEKSKDEIFCTTCATNPRPENFDAGFCICCT